MNVNNQPYIKKKLDISKILDNFLRSKYLKFTCASHSTKKLLTQIRKIDEESVIVINNFIENNEPFIKRDNLSDTVRLVSVGLLTRRKGFIYLFEALKLLKEPETDLKFHLDLFGEGEEKQYLESYIINNNLSNEIKMNGYRTDIVSILKQYDIFVIPSIEKEDFPYVVLEAMSNSLTVIGTKVAGIPEQILDYNFLVEPANSEELFFCLKRLLKNPSLVLRQRKYNYERFLNNYSYNVAKGKLLSLFK